MVNIILFVSSLLYVLSNQLNFLWKIHPYYLQLQFIMNHPPISYHWRAIIHKIIVLLSIFSFNLYFFSLQTHSIMIQGKIKNLKRLQNPRHFKYLFIFILSNVKWCGCSPYKCEITLRIAMRVGGFIIASFMLFKIF